MFVRSAIVNHSHVYEEDDIYWSTGALETTIHLSHRKGSVTIGGIDFATLAETVYQLQEQMAALRPIVKYARERAAIRIQRAWRRYAYAPGTGKLYLEAHNHWNHVNDTK